MGHHHFILEGQTMERFGLFGLLIVWLLNGLAFILDKFSFVAKLFLLLPQVETLKIISLYLAIIVSIVTIFWYLGNMLIKEQEFRQALKRKLKSIFKL